MIGFPAISLILALLTASKSLGSESVGLGVGSKVTGDASTVGCKLGLLLNCNEGVSAALMLAFSDNAKEELELAPFDGRDEGAFDAAELLPLGAFELLPLGAFEMLPLGAFELPPTRLRESRTICSSPPSPLARLRESRISPPPAPPPPKLGTADSSTLGCADAATLVGLELASFNGRDKGTFDGISVMGDEEGLALGVPVGGGIGLTDGISLCCIVGPREGTGVGLEVMGMSVGIWVGMPVGILVGLAVGTSVGFAVGSLDGWGVGGSQTWWGVGEKVIVG